MTPYLELRRLQVTKGLFQLGPLDLTLNQGDYLVLLGPTGCGKTTLLKTIAGFNQCQSEKIILNGHNLHQRPPHRRSIGYVTQSSDLFSHLNVEKNIRFGLRYLKKTKAEKEQALHEYLELFHLTHLAKRNVSTLSGGESKRTALARSLITQPGLLLLDEPLSMLDHNGREEMLQILKMIHSRLKTTTIHVTHDRHEAWLIADQCGVMKNGKLLQIDPVEDLFRKPAHQFTAEFLGGRNIFEATLKANQMKTSWGIFSYPKASKEQNGWVMIRPEQIHITEKSPHSAVIKSIQDMGEFLEIEAMLGTEKIYIHCDHHYRKLQIQQEIFLSWDHQHIHWIQRGTHDEIS